MPVAVDFNSLVGYPLSVARDKIALKFHREPLVSSRSQKDTPLEALFRDDLGDRMAILPASHISYPYEEIMDYVTKEFTESDVDFKVKESVLDLKGGLYQEYVFDDGFFGPDDEGLVPMAVVRSKLHGNPLNVSFGTYKFTCLNGALAGTTISAIEIGQKKAKELFESSIQNGLALAFDAYKKVAEKYLEMKNVSLYDAIKEFMDSDTISNGFKGILVKALLAESKIELTVKRREVLDEGFSALKILAKGTKWDLYNTTTRFATHEARSIGNSIGMQDKISEAFGV